MALLLGATFPTLEIEPEPDVIRQFAEAIEDMGYHHIVALEHVLGFQSSNTSRVGDIDVRSPFHEPLVLFGFLAAVTQRIELATGVLVIPQRQTALVAKQAAQVDVLSRGRLRLGIGVGWIPEEFRALDMEYQNRGRRSAEQIKVLRALWTRPLVTFHGDWHHIEAAGISPLPVQQPIPIWIGGSAEATLQRVATLGDGWFSLRPPDDRSREMVGQLREYARQADRSPDEIGIEAPLSIGDIPEPEWAGYAERWLDIGATHLFVNTMGAGLGSVDEHINAFEKVKAVLESRGLA